MPACIIVRRGENDWYDRVYRAFGDRVPVVWDRRRKASGVTVSADAAPLAERRQASPTSWALLGFVVVNRSL